MPCNPALDGKADPGYGGALAVQLAATSYLDNNLANIGCPNNGSELDQAFGVIRNDVLYLSIAGNLRDDGNRVIVFIDSVAGGQNTIAANNDSGNTISRLGTNGGNGGWGGAGLTFDTGFAPDHAIAVNIAPCTLFADYFTLPTGGGGTKQFLGQNNAPGSPGVLTGGTNVLNLQVTWNNSNTGGVTAGSAANASQVTNGLEYAIPLAGIGSPTGNVRVCVILVNNVYDDMSNQVLGSLAFGAFGYGHGSFRNFQTDGDAPGNQYFTVPVSNTIPPTPTSATATPQQYCEGAGGTITLDVPDGQTAPVSWYHTSCGGTPVGTGTPSALTIPKPATTRTYFARRENSCGNSACASVTVTVNPIPPTPTGLTSNPASPICNGGQVQLSVGNAGTSTINWYTDAGCTGTIVATGSPSTPVTPASGTTTNYYAQAVSPSGCVSPCSAALSVTAVNDPSIAIIAHPPTLCPGSSGTFVAGVSGGTGTFTYLWESSTTGCSGPWTTEPDDDSGLLTLLIHQTTTFRVTVSASGAGCDSATSDCVTIAVHNCDDGNPCTVDSCSGGACSNVPGPDGDSDTVPDGCDNCPLVSNTNQADQDADNIGDVCDTCTDVDGDGWGNGGNGNSGCPNGTAVDCDDSLGNTNDPDHDNVCGPSDLCPGTPMGEPVGPTGCTCDQVTCQNGGTCNLGVCTCPFGYFGTFCENSLPGTCCHPDGSCTIQPDSAACNGAGGSGFMAGATCNPGSCVATIPPGPDCWKTECGLTQYDFGETPILGDFFNPGSEPFDGIVRLGGGNLTGPDTVVQRMDGLVFNNNFPSPPQTVPIELVQLNLVSCQPITVRYCPDGSQPDETWMVHVDLSPSSSPPPGTMNVTKTHQNGGTFSSTFQVQPRFTFVRVTPTPGLTRVLDTGSPSTPHPAAVLTSNDAIPWVHSTSLTLDPPACGINFVPGVFDSEDPAPGCVPTGQCATTSCHEGPGHLHCVGPVSTPCPCGACINTTTGACTIVSGPTGPADCTTSGGVYKGDGTSCYDSDGDGLPDCVETGVACSGSSCVADSPSSSPTNPTEADTDGDGVNDEDDPAPTNRCIPTASPICDEYDLTVPGDGDSDNDGNCDLCEIESGASADCNFNGIPDENESGACCTGTACSTSSAQDCRDASGYYYGHGTTCALDDGDPCTTDTCSVVDGTVTHAPCPPNSTCQSGVCVCDPGWSGPNCSIPPAGACCLPNGNCQLVVTPGDCTGLNGTFHPGVTNCAMVTCPQPTCVVEVTCVSGPDTGCGVGVPACGTRFSSHSCPVGTCPVGSIYLEFATGCCVQLTYMGCSTMAYPPLPSLPSCSGPCEVKGACRNLCSNVCTLETAADCANIPNRVFGGPCSFCPTPTGPVNCDDGLPCTLDECDPLTGDCTHTNLPNGASCSDGNACNGLETCMDGVCVPGTPIICNDNNLCTTDSCDPLTGDCIYTPVDCDDHDACTIDSCDPLTGDCVHTPVVCDDNNPCTTDTCNPMTGCVFTQIVCNDNDACTTDSCDPLTGNCVYTPIVCNDNNACTIDTCNPATGCVFTPIVCDDNNPCTTDTCNPATGCVFTPIVCNDNNACTIDSCDPLTGDCVFTAIVCNDNNPCTTDTCNPSTGCVFTPIVCNDNNACTTDSCNPLTGDCVYTPIVCDDNDPCTTDSCNPMTGCEYTQVCGACCDGATCTDGLTQAACEAVVGRTFQGVGTDCTPNPCVANPTVSVTVELGGILDPTNGCGPYPATFTRCIDFVFYDCTNNVQEARSIEMEFSVNATSTDNSPPCTAINYLPITATESISLPTGNWYCAMARDPLHTLARKVVLSAGPAHTAAFTGTQRLPCGNLNNDPYIDILDFGAWAGQFLRVYTSSDTDCLMSPIHGDITGDKIVDIVDFHFITVNYLKSSDMGCCPSLVAPGGAATGARPRTRPVTRISVNELYQLGMGELAAGDVNNDGMVDAADVADVMMGQTPQTSAPVPDLPMLSPAAPSASSGVGTTPPPP